MTDQKPEEEVAWENVLRDAGVEIVEEKVASQLGHVELVARKSGYNGTFSALGDNRLNALKALDVRAKSITG